MSRPVTDDPRCLCAHRLSEHPEKYGLRMCSGHVLAVDRDGPDGVVTGRRAPCGCVCFTAATERQLRKWGDLPARTGAPDAPLDAMAPRGGIGRCDVAPGASVAGDDA